MNMQTMRRPRHIDTAWQQTEWQPRRARRTTDNPYRRSRPRANWSRIADGIAWAVVIIAGIWALAWIGSTMAHQLAGVWQ